GVTDVYEISDNGARDFRFSPARNGKGWISLDVDEPVPDIDPDNEEKVALAAVKSTDVLVLGAADDELPPGLNITPTSPGGRGAWYSLGFLLRGAAARLLEVQTNEIEVGLRTIRLNEAPTAQVFLSDTLANGAGYCTYLGEPENFERLLDESADWMSELLT